MLICECSIRFGRHKRFHQNPEKPSNNVGASVSGRRPTADWYPTEGNWATGTPRRTLGKEAGTPVAWGPARTAGGLSPITSFSSLAASVGDNPPV